MGKKTKKFAADIKASLLELENAAKVIPGQNNIVVGLAEDVAKIAAAGASETPLSPATLTKYGAALKNFNSAVGTMKTYVNNWGRAITNAMACQMLAKNFISEKEKKGKLKRKSLPKLVKLEKTLDTMIDMNKLGNEQLEKQYAADSYW